MEERPTTASGIPLELFYNPDDVPTERLRELAQPPGTPPFIRGAYPRMYRDKPWRIFQLSGYGSPEELNTRLKFLLEQGETGFIMKRDRMTNDHLYDPDHPEVEARREDVGQTGCVLLSARDVAVAVAGLPLSESYAHPGAGVPQAAPFCLTTYWTAAQRHGYDFRTLSGTGQSDFFLTYVGCPTKNQIPPRAALRLNCDLVEFCTEHMPRWVPVSIAGYNGADSGLNAYQELGAVMACAVEHIDTVRARSDRFDVAQFARGIGGINLRTSMAFFEDIAKLRAARAMWDTLMQRYGVEDPRARRLRIHVVTAGSAMTYQQPLNNIVRGTLMALVAVLGGTQSLGVSAYDEALSIPSDHAHQMSIRIQQILQEECGLLDVADPLGGAFHVEELTVELERRAWGFFEEIQAHGGFIAAIEDGWLQRHAVDNQIEESRAVEEGRRNVVGVTMATDDVVPWRIDGFQGGSDAWERGMQRLDTLRRERDSTAVLSALRNLDRTCRDGGNVVPAMLEAVGADASLGEVGAVYRDAFGDWRMPVEF